MSRYDQIFGGIFPSERKEEGWNAFQKGFENELATPSPTRKELLDIHDLVTSPYFEGDTPQNEIEWSDFSLYALDRHDGGYIEERFLRASRYIPYSKFRLGDWYIQAYKIYLEICKEDTEIELNPANNGSLRSLGRRKIRDGKWETVYGYGGMTYATKLEKMMSLESLFPPPLYFSLTIGLNEVYDAKCNKYDDIMDDVKDDNLDNILLAESFLDMVGVALHPFFDATSRTYLAHIALTLRRQGINVQEWGPMQHLSGDLSDVGKDFVEFILKKADLSIIRDEEHYYMDLSPRFRQNYMTKLREVIEDAIANGIGPNSHYFPFYNRAAELIKNTLVQESLVTAT
jgi:hypothetical protein